MSRTLVPVNAEFTGFFHVYDLISDQNEKGVADIFKYYYPIKTPLLIIIYLKEISIPIIICIL
ncbi:MAG TPA: hypothetical protein DHW61_07320 [Lachnoclostridium phytofermentans]|uniref:Uncharacterized protein n=1 Tax=Lachnoclostridium phytofermentans TaxID=66219 RepID=A0A3D2X4Z8_9FIRM|nr:hypothetical protein [Lachnoclostridium phytofermentans]